jgi:hypothetical protein
MLAAACSGTEALLSGRRVGGVAIDYSCCDVAAIHPGRLWQAGPACGDALRRWRGLVHHASLEYNLLLSQSPTRSQFHAGAHMLKIFVVTLTLLGALSACSMFGRENVHSGYVGTASLNQDQITRLLNEQGYTNVTGLHKNGPDWVGSATDKDGQTVNFDIDKDGTIHTK